jgi:steroid delta-isomerase-like uncharacterized protein
MDMTTNASVADLQAQSEQTERWVRRYLELSDAADMVGLTEVVDDSCEFHDVRYAPVIGKAALAEWAPKLFEGMTNQKPKALVNLAVSGRVAIGEFDFEGYHTGEYRGFAPTGNVIRWSAVLIYTFNDAGLLTRMMYYYDVQAFENQLRGESVAPERPTRKNDATTTKLAHDIVVAQSIETEAWLRQYLVLIDKRDVAALDPLIDDDVRFDDVRYDSIIGKAALVEWGAGLFAGLSEQTRDSIPNMAVTGRCAIAEFTFSATHTGEYFGFPGTGKRIHWSACAVYRFTDEGKLIHQVYYNDVEALEAQLAGTPLAVA